MASKQTGSVALAGELAQSEPGSRALHGLRAHFSRWLGIAALLPRAGTGVVAAAVVLNVVLGAMPVCFVIGTSLMIERVTTPSSLSPLERIAAPALLALGALVLQNVLSALQAVLGELVTYRLNGHCMRRLMNCGLQDAPMALLEQQDVLDKLSDARAGMVESFATPGGAAAGLLALIARYTQLVASVALLSVVMGLPAGVVIGLTGLVARLANRGALSKWSVVYNSLASARRRLRYLLETGSDAATGKDLRVLGIVPWWRARADKESLGYLHHLWRERRRVYFTPFLGFTALQVLGAVTVFVLLRSAALSGSLSLLELSMAVQAILIPIRFGVFFPESDVQTQYGMMAHDGLCELERRFSAERPASVRARSLAARSTDVSAADQSATGQSATDQSSAESGSGFGLPAVMPKAAIRFERVQFTYPGHERLILADLDLEIEAGRSTAIVGLNGAGKTTLVKLLSRLYEPTAGQIRVDGLDLRAIDARAWQRRLAIIFQDYVRYELDAKANVALGAPHRMDDAAALQLALDQADAAGVIAKLPSGLATPLSSRYAGGVDLSGGQWQRLALARALFAVRAGASVLVLDEPTAQLDVRAEAAFFDRFLELTRGLTSVLISHRFSTLRRADRIVVIEHGRAIEQGNHDELVAKGGRYAELFELQARRFAEQETDREQGRPSEARA